MRHCILEGRLQALCQKGAMKIMAGPGTIVGIVIPRPKAEGSHNIFNEIPRWTLGMTIPVVII